MGYWERCMYFQQLMRSPSSWGMPNVEVVHFVVTILSIPLKYFPLTILSDVDLSFPVSLQVWLLVIEAIATDKDRSGSLVCGDSTTSTQLGGLFWDSPALPWSHCLWLGWIQLMGKCSLDFFMSSPKLRSPDFFLIRCWVLFIPHIVISLLHQEQKVVGFGDWTEALKV